MESVRARWNVQQKDSTCTRCSDLWVCWNHIHLKSNEHTHTHTNTIAEMRRTNLLDFSLVSGSAVFLYSRTNEVKAEKKLCWSRFGFIEICISLICFVWRTVCRWFLFLSSSFFSLWTIIPNLSRPTIALLMQFFLSAPIHSTADVNYHRCAIVSTHRFNSNAMKLLMLMLMLIFVVQR